jgi:hypothetical protein
MRVRDEAYGSLSPNFFEEAVDDGAVWRERIFIRGDNYSLQPIAQVAFNKAHR